MIYLDHNATTPLHPRVLDAMLPYLRERFGNPSSPYRLGREAYAAVNRARRRIAEFLGAMPDEIVFTSGGTEADNLALRGVTRALFKSGNHLVTSTIEHHAVLKTFGDLEALGHRVTYLPVDPHGIVDAAALRDSLAPETILVSVMLANNETGVIQPVDEIVAIARERGVLVHTDAVQAAGKLSLRLHALGVDLASFSAHKICGPKGVGALYVRRGTPLAPLFTGGSHEDGTRAGTENVAGIVGFAEALAVACEAQDEQIARLGRLRDTLEGEIRARLDDVIVNGGQAPRVANTSNISFKGVEGESIVLQLDLAGIFVSTGSACTTGDPEPSHVLLGMGVDPLAAKGAIRFSLGPTTTNEDVAFTAPRVVDAVRRLRALSSLGERL
ncbi:MAG: cysteine desulfurase [Vicinamibacteria bacterium]|nr:cysteine desulfurase [Vicinamibacteria bacterium]